MSTAHLGWLAAIVAAGQISGAAIGQADANAPRPARDAEANLWNCTGSPADLPQADPAGGEVPLPKTVASWNAFHLFTSDTWRLHAIGAGHVTRPDGPPEVIFMDELGRCIVLTGDSGKYTPRVVVQDEKSMSAWALGDLDPRVPGPELYVGGGSGKLHRVNAAPKRRWVAAAATASAPPSPSPSTVVAEVDGASLSKFVIADLDATRPGNEMLMLTNNGPVFSAVPEGDGEQFAIVPRLDLGGRCRDAILLPATASAPARIAALLDTGEVALLVDTGRELRRTSLCKEDVSLCRLARRPQVDGEPEVVYVARVDGLVLRFVEGADGAFAREVVYAGPNGPRGLCAGHFDADPRVETFAVFGYSKKVQLLRRPPGGKWEVETIHVDTGGGHWLTTGELDGRNTTDEIVGGGFGYHVFLLTRVPGHGFADIAVDPDGGIPDYPIPQREPRHAPTAVPVPASTAK